MEITVEGIGDINGTLVLPFNKGDEGIDAVALSGLGDDLQTQITKLFTDKDVTGKTGERLTLHSPSAKAMLWGLGKASERTVDSCRSSGAKFFAGLKKRHGAFVARLRRGGPAQRAGLIAGDLISHLALLRRA